MQARQKFLDSLQPKVEERPLSATTDTTTKQAESGAGDKKTNATAPSTVALADQQPVTKQTPAGTTKKSVSSTGTKKGAAKDDAAKQAELAAAQQETAPPPPPPPVDEPLLDEPPPTKPKIILPPLDVKPFMK
jgi:hypothetical protein